MVSKPANSMNLNSTVSGLVNWDGASIMSSVELTEYYVVSGASSNTINNIQPSTANFVLTSNGPSEQPTFQALTFTQIPWTDEAVSFNAAVGNGYFVTATVTATLPASPSQGNQIFFAVDSVSGILTIQANTGQIIQIGKAISASAGTAVSNFNGDSVILTYRSSDTKWISTPGAEGTFTVT